MNPFHNPVFLTKMLNSYLFEINRLRSFDEKGLKKFQDKKLREIVQFAYSVPLYKDIYKKSNVKPIDIKGIKDIEKLPIVTKEIIKKYYPYGIISSKISKDKLIKISTSGTTGKTTRTIPDLLFIEYLFSKLASEQFFHYPPGIKT